MGLDQYLFTQENENKEATLVFYWRKHPDLHGFFANEWVAINPGKMVPPPLQALDRYIL